MNESASSLAQVTASEGFNASRQDDSGQDASEIGSSSKGNGTESEGRSGVSDNGRGSSSEHGKSLENTKKKTNMAQKTKGDEDIVDSAKLKRVMANRKSAHRSRQRRKTMLEELEKSVNTLSEENEKLANLNHSMRNELMELLQRSGLATWLPTHLLRNPPLPQPLTTAATGNQPFAASSSLYSYHVGPPAKRSRGV